MPNKIIVCLVGKSAAGKDSIAYLLSRQPGWHSVVSCTTRPKRDYEIDGKHYYFLTNEEFAQKVVNGDMLEVTYFNDWHYGTMKSDLIDGINVGVWNPEGYDCLRETVKFDKDVKLMAYYIQCDDKTRLLRSLNREKHPDVHEIVRRFQADEEDFEWLDNDDEIEVLWNEKDSDMVKCFQRILHDVSEVKLE
jgi:guanylate kinase